MIVAVKVFTTIIASVVAGLAALFCVASVIAHGSADPVERRQAVLSAFWSLAVFAFCVVAIISLVGCSTGRALYDACRDGLCR
jgi:hypothetical protein